MKEAAQQRWLPLALLVALVYPAVGVLFAVLDNQSAPAQIRIWRLAAWLVSATAFGVHLGYEHFRLRTSPLRAALHVSLAVAIGAFVLAVWVNLHGYWAASSHQSPFAPLALIAFPVITGVPAFVVALIVCALLAKTRRAQP